jgi:hypothetical protein
MGVVEVQIADPADAYAPFGAETSVQVALVSGSLRMHADPQSAAPFDVTEMGDDEIAIHAVKGVHASKVGMLAQTPLAPNRPLWL